METYYVINDICVCCGAPVPEGRQVCWECEKKISEQDNGGKQAVPMKKPLSSSKGGRADRAARGK